MLNFWRRKTAKLPIRKPSAASTPSLPSEDFGTSFAVAYTTDNVAAGYLAGGSISGAILGESAAEPAPTHYDSSSTATDSWSSSYDGGSSSSYDSGSATSVW